MEENGRNKTTPEFSSEDMRELMRQMALILFRNAAWEEHTLRMVAVVVVQMEHLSPPYDCRTALQRLLKTWINMADFEHIIILHKQVNGK